MKALLISLIELFVCCCSNCEEIEAGSVIAEIRNAQAIDSEKPTITVDFALTNKTDASIVLASRENSWGAYQWSFTMIDNVGDRIVFSNPQNEWLSNVFSVFLIAPKESVTMRCMLTVDQTLREDRFALFLPGTDPEKRKAGIVTHNKATWQYPVRLIGHFSAPRIHKINFPRAIPTNWTGSITSVEIKINKIEKDGGR